MQPGGQFGDARFVNQQERVVIAPESGGADVARQQRHALARAFGLRMRQQVFAFGGKAHAIQLPGLRARAAGGGGQQIRVFHKAQGRRQAAAVFFHLLRGHFGGAPVGHGGGGNQHIGSLQRGLQGGLHLQGRFHIHPRHAMRRGQVHGAGDQRDLRARQARRARNGKAHLAAGAVGEAPHGVDGFKRRPGRDHHAAARQCLRGERGDDFFQQFGRLQHAAIARFAAGLRAKAHGQHARAVSGRLPHVALRGRVRPHFTVHGGRQQQRRALARARQAQQREQIVRPACRQTGQKVGAGGGHEDGVCLAAQLDVRHAIGGAFVPLRGEHRLAGERLHRRGRDEVLRAFAHGHLHAGARLREQAAQLGGLVAGHAACQAQKDAAARQFGRFMRRGMGHGQGSVCSRKGDKERG